MTKFITTKVKPKSPATNSPQVRVFPANTDAWKRDSLPWLHQLHAEGFGLVEIHTLQLEGSRRAALFHIFVCEAMPLPLPPLPTEILHEWDAGSQLGHVIVVDLETSPPAIRVLENFWAGPAEEESHFEGLVMPSMDEIIASFGEGELWAS